MLLNTGLKMLSAFCLVMAEEIYCLLNDKKNAQNVWSKDLVYKKPFSYRVIHQKRHAQRAKTFIVYFLQNSFKNGSVAHLAIIKKKHQNFYILLQPYYPL